MQEIKSLRAQTFDLDLGWNYSAWAVRAAVRPYVLGEVTHVRKLDLEPTPLIGDLGWNYS